ncbi:MAG: LysR substrate-binding domain-containing protein [Peptococcaceae bacterium]
MNLEYLKTFYLAVKSNSISKAAKILNMSQPGVSIQIQALERELNSKLLDRSNKGVELTEAGQIVYDYAISILSIQENIERQLDSYKKQKTELIVSSCTTVGSYALPCSLYIFKERFPNVNVLLDITNSCEVINHVLNGSARIGLIEGNFSHKNISKVKITTDTLKIAVSPARYTFNHLSVEDFLKLPFIIRENGSGTREVFASALEDHNIKPEDVNVVMELCSAEAIKSAVIAGKGISIFSDLAIKKELATGALKEVKLAGLSFQAEYSLVYNKNISLVGAEEDFYDFIMSAKRGFC